MQVGLRRLLVASTVACVASCSLNDHGLGPASSGTGAAGFGTGAAATGGAAPGDTGTGGMIAEPTGNGGVTSIGVTMGAAATDGGASSDAAGQTSGVAGDASTGGGGATATGGASGGAAASGGVSGAGGTTASAGVGSAAATTGAGGGAVDAGGGGSAGSTSGAAGSGAGGAPSTPGCADGTREGYLDPTMYPTIAACAGAWDTPGLDSVAARTPQCNRGGGNDGIRPDGHGCAAVDLCETGWHVCATAHGVAVATTDPGCDDAVAPAGNTPVFYVTRQRGTGLVCDVDANSTATDNLFGCGNIGQPANPNSCAPLTRVMRDIDCAMNPPWMCSDGPIGTSQDEYNVVTKASSSGGGVLCCHD
jgi:hypothetical protein